MKKTLKKVFTFAVAILMVFSTISIAFAEDEPHTSAYTEKDTRKVGVTLGKASGSTLVDADHSYVAVKLLDLYKVMEPDTVTVTPGDSPDDDPITTVTKTQATDSEGNLIYQYVSTNAVNLATLLNATGNMFKYDPNTGAITLADETDIATQKGNNENASDAAKLAAKLAQASIGVSGTPMTLGQAVELECGYYVIFETANAGNDGYVATKPILVDVRYSDETANGIALTLKDANVTLAKAIVNPDTNNEHQNVVNIGDTVNFTITTNFPVYEANVSDAYTTEKPLKFIVTDTLSDGLTLTEDTVTVEVDGDEIEKGDETFTLTTSTHEFVVSFVPAFIAAHQGEDILVSYDAVLNQDAVYNHAEGNPNTVEVEFSNNPEVNDDTEKLTNTGDDPDNPDPDSRVYTFAFDLRKLDGAHASYLPGVTFNLQKNGANMKFVKVDDNTYIYDSSLQDSADLTDTITIVESGDITIIGLDEGTTYTLHEASTVSGYSLLANDATIVFTANDESGVLTGGATIETSHATIIVDGSNDETTTAQSALDGTSTANVVLRNYKGISLPETGSIAAIIISGLGFVASSAGAAFVLNRKKDEE